MTETDQTRPAEHGSQLLKRSRRRVRDLARRALWAAAPAYARRRGREAEMEAALGRLEADFEHVRERHTEQIERLEELVRELILTAESLRRSTPSREERGAD